jgi:DNA replication protein DnaC
MPKKNQDPIEVGAGTRQLLSKNMTEPKKFSEVETEKRFGRCEDCGQENVPMIYFRNTMKCVAVESRCDACQAQFDRKEAIRLDEERRRAKVWREERIEKLLNRAGVLPRYLRCRIENFKGELSKIRPVFITGPVGCGKTHLAIGYLANEIIEKGIDAGRFVRTVDLFKEIRNTFQENRGESEMDLLEKYGKVIPFLVIDDLGTEKMTDWVEQTLYDLIDRRYGECLETLITSNLSLDQLSAHYASHGDRLASRIAGMGPIVKIQGPDHRRSR